MSRTDTFATDLVLAVMRDIYGEVTDTKAVAAAYDNGITELPVDYYALKEIFGEYGDRVVASIFQKIYRLYTLNQIKAQ